MNFLSSLFRKKNIQQILSNIDNNSDSHLVMNKSLDVWDLTSLGIAAIIGAGIFSTIGTASFNGGPGVIFLFIFTALACGFAAFAYAEFASLLPVSGSAYTYSYVAFGELLAWIIGWALIMEYAVGNITVAVSWSGYLTGLLENNGIHIPAWMCIDYTSARNGFDEGMSLIASNQVIPKNLEEAIVAWNMAPQIAGLRLIADIPGIFITLIITYLAYIGIKESRNASNIMVAIKLGIVLLVIFLGAFYVKAENWNPFLPNGMGGVLAGVSSVFFAYIGFDAISTTAEECKNPQRDLPRGMMYAIIICTVLYVLIALVLTGMVKYTDLKQDDPLAYVFGPNGANLTWISGIIALSAVVAMASVMLVFQLGQPRIWMSMSRDGLLPKAFSKIHPRYKTPSFATIITGLCVIIPMLFIPSDVVLDLCSMGTLFAFVVVCGGVIKLHNTPDAPKGKFQTPYINAKFVFPALLVLTYLYITKYQPAYWGTFANQSLVENFPMILFALVCLVLVALGFKYKMSLIPVLGLVFCFYMMAQIPSKSWFGFIIWLCIGLLIYFTYGYRHSKLSRAKMQN